MIMNENNGFEIRNLILFFVIAIGFSWIFWIPRIFYPPGSSPFIDFLYSPFNPAAWGPLIAALLLTYLNKGPENIKDLLKRGIDLSFKKKWLIPIFLLFPVITLIALVIAIIFEGFVPELIWATSPYILIFIFIYIFLLGGPLQEEYGWRGYALERLQVRYNAFTSSLIMGIAWVIWHLPLFFTPTSTLFYNRPIWGFVVSIMLISILMTWIYNNTKRSILACMIFHTTVDFAHVVLPAVESDTGGVSYVTLLIIVVVIVLLIWGYKRLVKQSLEFKVD